jgi:hypothetical protein
MMETIVTTIILGFIGVSVAGLVLIGLMKLWFWMDENERGDR